MKMMTRIGYLIIALLFLTSITVTGQDQERVTWLHSNMNCVLFERNPDTSSTDRLINTYVSDGIGTDFYSTITSAPVHYDYVLSPWTREVFSEGVLLLETEEGLALADRDGQLIRQTSYDKIIRIQETEWLQGRRDGDTNVDVFRLNDVASIFSVQLEGNVSLSYEAGCFWTSGYEQPTRIYDQQGKLLIEEAELDVVPLATDEPRFHYQNRRLFTNWIADAAGNVLVELPKSTLFVKGQGQQIKVQTGATKMYWIDLAGNRIVEPFSEELLPGR